MANVKHIRGGDEGSDEVSDPQYELFLASLKKYKKSYIVKDNINDVSLSVKYEGRRLKPKCGAADQSPRLPNERQHEDVDQNQPGKKHNPCPRKSQVTKNCPEQHHSKIRKGRDTTDSDVDIIDSATFYRVGNLVQTVKEDGDIELLARTSTRFDYRRQLMNALQKRYSKGESEMLRKAFIAGSYVKFHPELVQKLTIRRHTKGKCLVLLRGFFFWLENLTQDGSFKPWRDEECLEVDC